MQPSLTVNAAVQHKVHKREICENDAQRLLLILVMWSNFILF